LLASRKPGGQVAVKLLMNSVNKNIFFLLFLVSCTHSRQPIQNISIMTSNYAESFQLKAANKILIEYFSKMSDQRDNIAADKSATITDVATIQRIVALLNELPDEGDMMVKMGDVPLMKVSLIFGDSAVYFEYYDKKIKTPATSFYSTTPKQEQALFSLLSAALR
jgi:hypothetical protein